MKRARKGSKVRRRRKSSKKRSVSLPVVVETVERGTFADAKDEAIEDMKAEQNFSFRLSLGDVTKRTDETQRQIAQYHESLAKLGHNLRENQTGLIIERLKNQISKSGTDFEKEAARKQNIINGLMLENSYQVEVSLLAKMNSEKLGVRSELLHACPKCNTMIAERIDNYAKVLKNLWEQQATEVIVQEKGKSVNEKMIESKKIIIENTVQDLNTISQRFERQSKMLVAIISEKDQVNKATAFDHFTLVNKLKQVEETYESVKQEFEKYLEVQKSDEVERKEREIALLKTKLSDWNRRLEFRAGVLQNKKKLETLKKVLRDEQTTRSRLKFRINQLEEATKYTLESFKHSNKVHSDYLKEVNEKLVPELQENARQQALDLQLAQVEGSPLKKHLEKRMACFVSRKHEGAMMNAEVMQLLTDISASTAHLNWLDNAIARTESDLKSTKLDWASAVKNLKDVEEEITTLEAFKKEGVSAINKASAITKSLLIAIPGMDRQRTTFSQMKNELSSTLLNIRVNLRKSAIVTSPENMWPLLKELSLKLGKEPLDVPEYDTSYAKKVLAADKVHDVIVKLLRQAVLLSQKSRERVNSSPSRSRL